MKRATNNDFIHLHNHTDAGSNMIMKDSIVKVKDLITYTNSLGNKGVAITDHECLSAHVKGINIMNKLKEDKKLPEDFKLILGNEIYLLNKQDTLEKRNNSERINFYHCILLAKDKIGHKQLRELSSRAWRDNYFSYRGISRRPTYYSDIEEIIGNNKGHLIMQTACLGSYLGTLSNKLVIAENEQEQLNIKQQMVDFIDWAMDIFEDDFYLEMQPNKSEEQVFYNKLLVSISKAYNIPLVITTDTHYINENLRGVHKAFLTSDEKDANREVDEFYETTRFFKVEEIYDYMDYIEEDIITEAILNTKTISNKCQNYDWFHSPKIPITPLPPKEEWYDFDKNILEEYPNMKSLYNDKYEHHTYLIHEIFKGIEYRKISKEDMKETLDRVELESGELVGIAEKLKEPIGAYFISMKKNEDIIWEVSVIGAGRGSAVSWIINYLLDITQINPLKQENIQMPHWRFLTKERPELADIDIDYSSHLKNTAFNKVREYYRSIGGDCVRVATFRTETTKSAILSACRGLNINSDIAQYISSLVNIERGFVWSVSDMYYGNKEKNRKPVKEFVDIINKYEDNHLLTAIENIEGLISGCSSHASGVLCLNEPLEETNSFMRTPSGELITAYDLHESEQLSNVKFDFLLTNGISLIQLTIEMLVKYGHMKWQGSLKATYNKYLLPEYIDIKSDEIWDIICQGKLMNIFQFETPVGAVAIQKLQPRSLLDLANANSLMRLMNPNGEQPLDKYIRFRNNPQLWDKEMIEYGLNEKDRKILHKELDNQYGVCSNQESMMLMFMNKDISNFNIVEANLIRKAIAKKDPESLQKSEVLFYKKGEELNIDKKLLDYCWNVETGYQKGYGFSLPHTTVYSIIALQEANLFHYYPSIYWYTANLISMSGSLELEDIADDNFEVKEQNTNYGKVAKAISRIQNEGVKVDLPDINNSDLTFIPREETNSILFGLKGISGINNNVTNFIIDNRPYTSLLDFHKKLVETKREVIQSTGKKQNKSYVSVGQTITLIKAGAFDKLENKPREQILEDYIMTLNPNKKQLTMQNINKVIELGLVSEEYKPYIRMYNFKNYLNTLPFEKDENSKSIKWVCINIDNQDTQEYVMNFIEEFFMSDLEEEKGYRYNEDGVFQLAISTKRKGSLDYIYDKKMAKFKNWLNSKECLDNYNYISSQQIKQQYMKGNISKWEMESLGMYYHEHELTKVNKDKYDIKNFFDLSEEPDIVGYNEYKGVKYPKFDLVRIVGTILDKDKNKHTVSLLTLEGVVNLKFYSGQFNFYDKTLSIQDEELGKKVVIEESWFKKGNKVMVTGFRRGDDFVPKKYKNSIYQHTIQLITSLNEQTGDLSFKSERTKID